MNHEEMMKSISALIDETLAEVEELKKSDRFSASEIKIEGPGAGIAGKPTNGSLGKEEDKEDEDEDEDMDKAEGKNSEADPNAGKHAVVKGEGAAMDKAEGKNAEADPNAGKHVVVKAEDKDDEDKKKDKKDEDDKAAFLKKSVEESSTLMKSYVDQRLAPIESKLESILDLVKQVSNAPVPAKSVSYRGVAPLAKSIDEGEPLNKSAVVNKLFELKKSGTNVSSVDIASAELAGPAELAKIANKYNIK